MLRNTFVHVPGIGPPIERALWESGCSDWDRLLAEPNRFSYGQAERDKVNRHIARSQKALTEGRHQFFRKGLGLKEAWRAWPDFRSSCVYLDIETDGSAGRNAVTMIGMYDGREFRCLIQGEDLENFRDLISNYSMIVTFCGANFDLPALQRQFWGLRFDQIHLDLQPTLRRLDLRGGLKRIEKELGIHRSPETDGLTGYDAVLLWRRYIKGHDDSALDKLIAYNREDVVNLEKLAEVAYEGLRKQVFDRARAEPALDI